MYLAKIKHNSLENTVVPNSLGALEVFKWLKIVGCLLNIKNQNEMLYIFTGLIYFVIYKTVTS